MSSQPLELSLLQRYFLARNEAGVYSSFLTGAKLDKPIVKDDLERAINSLVSQRKTLRSTVVDGKVHEITIVPSDVTLYVTGDQEMEDLLNEIHETKYPVDQNKPMWTLFVYGNWLIYACNHIFSDGTGSILVVEDLIRLLNGQELTPDVDFSAKYDKIIKPSWLHFTKTIVKELSTVVKSIGSTKNESRVITTQSFKTQIRIIKLDRGRFQKIKQFTKREVLSFTELLMCLNYLVLEHLSDDPLIKIDIPINQRRALGDGRAYGAYVSSIVFELPRDIKTWGDLKSQVKIKQSSIEKSVQDVGMLKYIDMKTYIESNVSNGLQLNRVEISNLGLREHITGNYTADEYIFSQSYNPTHATLNNSLISSTDWTTIVVTAPLELPNFKRYFKSIELLFEKLSDPSEETTIEELRGFLVDI